MRDSSFAVFYFVMSAFNLMMATLVLVANYKR